MTGSLEPHELRISDADRHKVAEILREAAGDGRIDMTELDERLEATYAAKTYGDLVPITVDLPVAGGPTTPSRAFTNPVLTHGRDTERGVAIMSGFERKGVWVVPRELQVFCLMGGADLDLREAQFSAREVTITVNAVMGGAEITVNPGAQVIMEGIGVMGAFAGPREGTGEPGPDAPTVRVRGFALMGGVSVTRKGPPGISPHRRLHR